MTLNSLACAVGDKTRDYKLSQLILKVLQLATKIYCNCAKCKELQTINLTKVLYPDLLQSFTLSILVTSSWKTFSGLTHVYPKYTNDVFT